MKGPGVARLLAMAGLVALLAPWTLAACAGCCDRAPGECRPVVSCHRTAEALSAADCCALAGDAANEGEEPLLQARMGSPSLPAPLVSARPFARLSRGPGAPSERSGLRPLDRCTLFSRLLI